MMLSSLGQAVGRYPSWSSRVKKSVPWVSGGFAFGCRVGDGTNHPRICSRGVWRRGHI
jgi:hypothetical protein